MLELLTRIYAEYEYLKYTAQNSFTLNDLTKKLYGDLRDRSGPRNLNLFLFEKNVKTLPLWQAWRLWTCWSRCISTTQRSPGSNRSRGLTVTTQLLSSQVTLPPPSPSPSSPPLSPSWSTLAQSGVERSVYYSRHARDMVASLIQSSKEFAFVTSIRYMQPDIISQMSFPPKIQGVSDPPGPQ